MKIQIKNSDGSIRLYPRTEPKDSAGYTTVEVTPEIQAVLDQGGPFQWVWTDEEDYSQGGTLTKVPRAQRAKSLRERLFAHATGFPPSLRAGFPFADVSYWLDKGDEAAAKAVIEGVDVSAYPQAVQDAKAAMLGEFPSE